MSFETRLKIANANRKRLVSKETRDKMRDKKLGHYVSKKTRYLMSLKRIGIKHNKSWNNKVGLGNKGKVRTLETRMKISKSKKFVKSNYCGNKNHFWRGGVSKKNWIIRKSIKYRKWRECVFVRDNYTCKDCGMVGGKLEAHHIKSFSKYPILRFDINNGKTLCIKCHKKTDNYGNKSLAY